MYLWNYRLSNIWLDECLVRLISGQPLMVKISKRTKYLSNLHETNFVIIFAEWKQDIGGKNLYYWYFNPSDSLLKPWLLTTSILLVIVRSCGNQSKCNYIKYYRHFLNILLNLRNLHQIFNILKKMMNVAAYVFSQLHTLKGTVTHMFK